MALVLINSMSDSFCEQYPRKAEKQNRLYNIEYNGGFKLSKLYLISDFLVMSSVEYHCLIKKKLK